MPYQITKTKKIFSSTFNDFRPVLQLVLQEKTSDWPNALDPCSLPPWEGWSRCYHPLLHQAYSHLDRRAVLWELWDRRVEMSGTILWEVTVKITFNWTPRKEEAFVFRLRESRISINILHWILLVNCFHSLLLVLAINKLRVIEGLITKI